MSPRLVLVRACEGEGERWWANAGKERGGVGTCGETLDTS